MDVIIPIGLRCFTKEILKNKHGVSQSSLPFDYGFFTPESVISVINFPIVNYEFPDFNRENHSVCIKNELSDTIEFTDSSYEEIDNYIYNNGYDNKYLDAKFGYYTLDKKHNFILAHYNWHKIKRDRIYVSIETNLSEINKILNKRIKRMFSLCEEANTITLAHAKSSKDSLIINNTKYNISYLDPVAHAFENKFNKKVSILQLT
jgi:hypothetical protein